MAYSQAFRTPLPLQSTAKALSAKAASFSVDSAKLQPQFEAYKLVQEQTSSWSTASYPLPARPPALTELFGVGSLAATSLGYKETKERSLHQLLVPAKQDPLAQGLDPFAAYIDRNRFLVALTYDAQADRVVGHPIYRLPEDSKDLDDRYSECLPSLCCVTPRTWIASDGFGKLSVLRLEKQAGLAGQTRWTAACVQTATFSISPAGPQVPVSIKAVTSDATGRTCKLLLQSMRSRAAKSAAKTVSGLGFNGQGTTTAARTGKSSSALFEVHCVDVPLPAVGDLSEANTETILIPKWSVSGSEPLIHVDVDAVQGRFRLCAEAPFSLPRSTRQSVASSTSAPSVPTKQPTFRSRRPPHYSWAQTSDTVTIVFSLPVTIDKPHIRSHFSSKGLSLSLSTAAVTGAKITELDETGTDAQENDDPLHHAAQMISSGRYVSRPTWADIDADGSVWTWEKVVGKTGEFAGRPVGLLTLHLEKKHEGTRWPQVFGPRARTAENGEKPSKWEELSQKTRLTFAEARDRADRVTAGDATGDEEQERADAEEHQADDDEDDVPETLDPSELLSMLEGMDKYTVDEGSGSGYGLDRTGIAPSAGQGGYDQPSLLRDGLEDEDAFVGRNLVVTTVHSEAARFSVDRLPSDAFEHCSLLATPLPQADSDEVRLSQNAIVIKHDLDGCVFERPRKDQNDWTHTDTAPAIAFVLASKRDAHRVYIHRRASGQTVILAFEGAPQVTGGSKDAEGVGAGNLFVYYAPTEPGAKYSQSRVIRLGSNSGDSVDATQDASGALLGVCCAQLPSAMSPSTQDTLVCLCEKGLLVLTGVL